MFDKVVYLQVLREMYSSDLHKLARCFALVGQKHWAHLTEVSTLKEGHKKEVEGVSWNKTIFFFFFLNKVSFNDSDIVLFYFAVVEGDLCYWGRKWWWEKMLKCPLLRLSLVGPQA